ncbi:uncharacterized protein LOC144878882 [Branchiostoma floridae x Branchiostoma japonicum]
MNKTSLGDARRTKMASLYKVDCKDEFLREKLDPMLLTTLDDFTRSTSNSSSSLDGVKGISDPADFVRQNGAEFSVYTVDFGRRVLGLVKVRRGLAINRAPFFFQAQRENAAELLLIPFDILPSVVDAVKSDAAVARNVFLHNTGRCGSTLLCKAMEASTEVQAVSEPDVYTWIYVYAKAKDFQLTSEEEEDILMVLRGSTILLNFYLLQNDPSRRVICYKLRGFAVFVADLLQRAIPHAKTIFLYRDLPGFFDSWISVLFSGSYWKYFLTTMLRIDRFLAVHNMMHMVTYFKKDYINDIRLVTYTGTRGIPFFFVSTWLLRMQKAYDLIRNDPSNFFHSCVRYNELVTQKEKIDLDVMKQVGIDIHSEECSKMKEIFDRNSQEGTSMQSVRKKADESESSWVGTWERNLFSEVIDHFEGNIDNPEFILENTTVEAI